MPSLFTEIIRYAVGTTSAAKATLSGKVYSGEEALSLGLVDSLTSRDGLLTEAIVVAKRLAPDCNTAYAFSKEALQAPALKRIREETDVLDRRSKRGARTTHSRPPPARMAHSRNGSGRCVLQERPFTVRPAARDDEARMSNAYAALSLPKKPTMRRNLPSIESSAMSVPSGSFSPFDKVICQAKRNRP
jgi:ClpP class serine protease